VNAKSVALEDYTNLFTLQDKWDKIEAKLNQAVPANLNLVLDTLTE
jgi:hypothetical protein